MTTPQLPRTTSRINVIKALAHPSRLTIVEALQSGEQCVCDLRNLVGTDLSTVSKHLAILRSAGLLSMEKRGLKVFYRLSCPCFLDFLNCVDRMSSDSSSSTSCSTPG